MKNSFILTLALLIMSAPSSFAADQVTVDAATVSARMEGGTASNPFGFIVKEGGQLIAKPGAVFTQGGNYSGMELPFLLSNPKPISYPRWAVKQGWQGQFIIALEILPNGNVGRYKVMQSTGHRMLDDAATKAIQTWKFHPAMKSGKATVTCIEIPVTFQLENA